MRHLSPFDKFIHNADLALRTLIPGAANKQRPSPASIDSTHYEMDDQERKHAAGLMRINHTGEVCAQALYQGQALTAKLPEVREAMDEAAAEEIDHLVWCEDRITQLGSHTSVLNPAFYGLSFGIGALAGAVSDKVSLGFVAETERQVCKHLTEHMTSLPKQDEKSKKILLQMLDDEAKHATAAIDAGGHKFPLPVRAVMTGLSKVMTKSVYKL
ncbi:MAG: ubiquinone biosynthesis monooxygenase Coq7 [Oleispira sp.]|jgi:ubiquinone biosynthesis monooxygenase Coq7|tara:strand:+ start:4558 stop:5199 length:642 start_codon:yes stop_codon:yes gene_type:complete